MVILELREVYEELDQKAKTVQREFTGIADRLAVLRRMWSEEEESERPKIVAEQEQLKDRQLELAEEVNLWRDRMRAIDSPKSEQTLHATLDELKNCGDEKIVAAVQKGLVYMAMDPEEKAALFQKREAVRSSSPAGRLLERGRTSYDLRQGGPAALQKAALEFANRPNISQDDDLLAELESALQDSDPIVSDLAMRALIQMLRFRATRSAEMAIARKAVQALSRINNRIVVPTLIEVLTTPRTGYVSTEEGVMEEQNNPDRLMALITLVEHWRSSEVQEAVRTRMYDKDLQISNAAERALEAFPGEWS